ncbi:MAG: MetQ/NlpA family ABC transporter substrate-binding protein [Succinivibrio sp.]|nr:MetQ/NlpA family ABC transporter substrate-binding protein [Succinivibrio sp.]
MLKFKHFLTAAAAVSFIAAPAAFAEKVTVGATPVPHAEILEFIQPELKKQGYDLEVTVFNDYVQPNLTVSDNQLDTNFFQHRPYLENFVDEHGSDLVEVAAIHIEPMGIYSRKVKDLKELKDGATVSIPNDPTNGGRALLLLQSAGLLTLVDPTSITATVQDIKDNPKKLKVKELEAPQLPRSLDDVDIAIINTNYAIDAALNPLKDAIYIENSESPYVNILVASSKSKDKKGVQALIKALKSDAVRTFINDKYQGAVVPAF